MNYRIGIGYDIHRLVRGRRLFLGGIEIAHTKGLLGHSDADVLLHAVCDALLGAAAAPDIGELFPDTDPRYRGISSAELLKKVLTLIKKKGFRIVNLDTVIIAEEPKLSGLKMKIRRNIARLLNIKEDRVNVKAKTNEGLGALGRKNALASYAVALLTRGA